MVQGRPRSGRPASRYAAVLGDGGCMIMCVCVRACVCVCACVHASCTCHVPPSDGARWHSRCASIADAAAWQTPACLARLGRAPACGHASGAGARAAEQPTAAVRGLFVLARRQRLGSSLGVPSHRHGSPVPMARTSAGCRLRTATDCLSRTGTSCQSHTNTGCMWRNGTGCRSSRVASLRSLPTCPTCPLAVTST